MAPETAGPGASLEWRSVETSPKSQGLSARPLLGKGLSPASPAISPRTPPRFCACTRAHTRTCPHVHISACTNTGTPRMHGLPRARGFTHTRAQMCGVWPSAPLYPGLITSKWQVCTPIFCGGRCSLGADKGGRDALGCWTNLRSCLCFFLNPLHILAFPAFPLVISLLCLLCAFCCLLIRLSTPLPVPSAGARSIYLPQLPLPLLQPCFEPECVLKNQSSATAARRAAATQPLAIFSSAEHRSFR